MYYAVAISNYSENKLFVYASSEDIALGERVVVPFRNKKNLAYVVQKFEGIEEITESNLEELIDLERTHVVPSKIPKITERCDYISFIDNQRTATFVNCALGLGYPIGRLFDLSFPPSFDKYFSLFVESNSPLINIPKMRYDDFKKMSKAKEYIESGLVRIYRDFESKKPRPRSKEEYVRIIIPPDELPRLRLTSKQSIVVNYLLLKGTAKVDELLNDLEDENVERSVLVQLKNKGIVKINDEPIADEESGQLVRKLTEEQSKIVKSILEEIDGITMRSESLKHMVFGPTGSGKTEVYLDVIKHALNFGSVIYLVPEISLTEQTIARLRKHFPDVPIGVYHSYQTDAKRVEIWAKAVKGELGILVGPRSAFFVPMRNLKLVIVDEEHDEGYYNNSEPFYDVRKLLQYFPIPVIFGSATPHLETYKLAKDGIYQFHVLTKRFNVELPEVEIIDMRKEKKSTPSISKTLREEIESVLNDGMSALIFTRRKGFSRVQCAVCGYIAKCDNCDVSMTYHSDAGKLKCHICGSEKPVPSVCPVCGSQVFTDKGTGTEKVERELRELFPGKNIGRIDAEIIDTPEKLKKVLEDLREGKLEIVTGTKMITKGLDIYRIGLVGIIDVDALIFYPDINAPLRTFQLLVQVIGRAGRKQKGKAVIQTYDPSNPVIIYASAQDVTGYYERELALRKELSYPPFADVVHVMYSNQSEEIARETIDAVYKDISNAEGLYIEILGPSEHPIFKVANKYRYQFFVKTVHSSRIVRLLNEIKTKYPGDWIVRLNPPEI
ncbi:primosomal protein N' [Fervidobacterium islandicum]|uniref:Replication restart protein PriA n=1 Tax=Fervidobacterium islandicum TaxID=2423 RepID=A0AAI8CNA9_FERIS|nr:primosomal protein N' [Fervidobacterium islandicum]AMW33368.1 primosomal protein N' [Fervidobacterium islandicum]